MNYTHENNNKLKINQMEQEDKKPIDLKSLSLEERKELAAQLKEEERQEKERKQNEKKVLQELTEEVIDKNIDDCLKVQGISNDFILKIFQEAETIITARAESYLGSASELS